MKYKAITIILLLFLPIFTYADGNSRGKIFGVAGFAFSLIAIGADIYADHYYDKYEKATIPSDCEHYRNRTIICERTRDISGGLAVINFSLSTVFLLKNKKSELGFEINLEDGKLCAGVIKLLN